MNTLLLYFFRLLIIASVVVFFVGLFKREWLYFRGKQMDTMTVVIASIGLFMVGFTGASSTFYTPDAQVVAASKTGVSLSEAAYGNDMSAPRCPAGTKSGKVGASNDEKTDSGVHYTVRTPTNYKDTIAHPLLMVYAPAGKDRSQSEEFMYLTKEATAAGFIVAYADHRPMSPETIVQLAEIPQFVEQKWCVDKKRIFMTGHSDGGSIAMGIAFFNGTKHIPTAIAPSAVGMNSEDFEDRNCVKPTPVMLMHSSKDKLFPNFGKQAIEWWAKCNKCNTKTYDVKDRKAPASGDQDWESYYKEERKQKALDYKSGNPLPNTTPVDGVEGCVAYSGCKNNVQTWYCEGTGLHPEWPGKNKDIINFFKAVASN
jgi:polyhydroxybutyrate depolymerase